MKWNKTSRYLIRPLGFVRIQEPIEDFLKNIGFVQGFIGDIQADTEYTCPVYLLCENNGKLEKFIENEYKEPYHVKRGTLVEDYDYPGFVVLVYEFPEKYREDYQKILNGEYSKVSLEFQSMFPKEKKDANGKKTVTHVYKVFNKAATLKLEREEELDVEIDEDVELDSKMNLDNSDPYEPPELLDITNYVHV